MYRFNRWAVNSFGLITCIATSSDYQPLDNNQWMESLAKVKADQLNDKIIRP
jgi:hypothetical protein